jgi:hypothetical protein
MAGLGHLHPYAASSAIGCRVPEAAISPMRCQNNKPRRRLLTLSIQFLQRGRRNPATRRAIVKALNGDKKSDGLRHLQIEDFDTQQVVPVLRRNLNRE